MKALVIYDSLYVNMEKIAWAIASHLCAQKQINAGILPSTPEPRIDTRSRPQNYLRSSTLAG